MQSEFLWRLQLHSMKILELLLPIHALSLKVHATKVLSVSPSIEHFKDVNNNKDIGTLLRMSGPEAFPVAPFLNHRPVKTK